MIILMVHHDGFALLMVSTLILSTNFAIFVTATLFIKHWISVSKICRILAKLLP